MERRRTRIMGIRERVGRIGDLVSQQVLVLIYHQVGRKSSDPVHVSIPEDVFSAQMETLREKCNPISLDQMMQALEGGVLPPRAVAVTFDDGYASVLERALPILRRWKIPATVFLPAGLLGGGSEFWWDELQRVIWEAEGDPAGWSWLAQDIRMRLRPQTPREDTYRFLQESLRVQPPDNISAELERMRKAAKVPQKDVRPDVRPLSWEEAGALASEPLIRLGAHTMRHPWLAALGTADQRAELEESAGNWRRDWQNRSGGLPIRTAGGSPKRRKPCGSRARPGSLLPARTSRGACGEARIVFGIPRVPPGNTVGGEFSLRIEEYLFYSGLPRVPKGYLGPAQRIRSQGGIAVDGSRVRRLPRALIDWLAYHLRRDFAKPVRSVPADDSGILAPPGR